MAGSWVGLHLCILYPNGLYLYGRQGIANIDVTFLLYMHDCLNTQRYLLPTCDDKKKMLK
jgi:hypothetical protein